MTSTIIVAQCALCPFQWIGPRSKIAAQKHADKTGHPVEVQTITQDVPVELE